VTYPIGLSVVLPIHGDAPFFEEAYESILFEGIEEDYELLLILDKTTRDLSTLADSTTKNVRLIDSKRSGVAHAHNEGIKSAKFDLIAIAHSDDIYAPNRLIRQLSFLRNHPEVVCVGTQIDLIDEKGSKIGHGDYPVQPKTVARAMRYKSAIAHPTAMYRKSIAMSVGGYRQDFAPAEDYDLWRRMIREGQFANLATTEIGYRLHKGQTSSAKRRLSSKKKAEVLVLGLDHSKGSSTLSKLLRRIQLYRLDLNDFLMMSFATFSRGEQKVKACICFCLLFAMFPLRTIMQGQIYLKTKEEVIEATRQAISSID
jgi:glycosyltransferase involved in cell wall biosynthesis